MLLLGEKININEKGEQMKGATNDMNNLEFSLIQGFFSLMLGLQETVSFCDRLATDSVGWCIYGLFLLFLFQSYNPWVTLKSVSMHVASDVSQMLRYTFPLF